MHMGIVQAKHVRDLALCDVERGNETLRTPPSLTAICRGGSPLPSPPAPGAYAPLAGAGCGAPPKPWAFCAPPQRPGPLSCLCSGVVGYGVVVWWWWWWWW